VDDLDAAGSPLDIPNKQGPTESHAKLSLNRRQPMSQGQYQPPASVAACEVETDNAIRRIAANISAMIERAAVPETC